MAAVYLLDGSRLSLTNLLLYLQLYVVSNTYNYDVYSIFSSDCLTNCLDIVMFYKLIIISNKCSVFIIGVCLFRPVPCQNAIRKLLKTAQDVTFVRNVVKIIPTLNIALL